MKLTNPSHQI